MSRMQDNDGVIAVKQIAIWCLIKIIRSFHPDTHKISTCLLLNNLIRKDAVEMLFLEYHSYAEFVILSNLINCWQDSLYAFKYLCFCLPQKFSCNNISSVYAMKWKFLLILQLLHCEVFLLAMLLTGKLFPLLYQWLVSLMKCKVMCE